MQQVLAELSPCGSAGEIRRRQVVGLVGLFFSLSSLVALVSVSAPREARLGIFLPLMVASVGYVQSRSKFCLAYGFAGTFNLGKLGDLCIEALPG